jgi:proteasome lid subunit RPN8/RPN11
MKRGPDMSRSPAPARGVLAPGGHAHGGEEIPGLRAASDAVIYRHIFSSADREVGGILVGRTAVDGGLPLVTGAIPAISADEQRATLTFTQEAWAHVHRTLESEFPPDEQIVGWYHSHPGFGVFLSGHDLFIHENFFNAPSQIAVVIDPRAEREGAFVWRGRELTALFERATPRGWIASTPGRDGWIASAPGRDGWIASTPSHDGWIASPAAHGSSAREESGPLHGRSADPARAGYPLVALVIAAIVGVAIGFGLWSLAEGGGAAQPSRRGGATPAKTHRAKPAPAAENHIEVLRE